MNLSGIRIHSSFYCYIARREHAVRNLLCRHCCLSADHGNVEKERFMLDDLKIPAEWIHEAKVRDPLHDFYFIFGSGYKDCAGKTQRKGHCDLRIELQLIILKTTPSSLKLRV